MTTENQGQTSPELAALQRALVPAPRLSYTRYNEGIRKTNGESKNCSWAEWAAERERAGNQHWPSGWDMDAVRWEGSDSEWDERVQEYKELLPYEVGCLMTGPRADKNVGALTWLFVDIDGLDSAAAVRLRDVLQASGVNYLLTESCTSRMSRPHGELPLKLHAYVQIVPIIVPSASITPRDTFKKDYWVPTYARACAALKRMAGLTEVDTSVDDLAQPAFVAYVPAAPSGSEPRPRRVIHADTGKALDLDAWLSIAEPNVPSLGPSAAPTAPASPAPAAHGPTPGHTTGSLVKLAAEQLGTLGPCVDTERQKYLVLCPWRNLHKSDPGQAMGRWDSSTVLYDNVTAAGEDGGFECKHEGCRDNGRARTAADFLSFARLQGTDLPDRPGYGAVPLGPAEATAESQEKGGEKKRGRPRKERKPPTRVVDGRQKIPFRADNLAGMRDAVLAAMARRADIFLRSSAIHDLLPSGLRLTPDAHLEAVLSECVCFVKTDAEGDEKAIGIPNGIVGALQDRGHWPGLRPLRAIVSFPALLPDGRLLSTPGYDADSQLLFAPDDEYPVPESPTREDALAARDRLVWFVRHTQFVDANGPSVWLSLVLTLVGRQAMSTVPAFGFDAAEAQSGKTALVKIAYALIYGQRVQTVTWGSETERGKEMPSWSTTPLVFWDNLAVPFADPNIDMAITAARARVRKFGQNGPNATWDLDFSITVWAYTGNNLAVGEDAASRCLIARIEKPATRRYDFDVDDDGFFRSRRRQAIIDCLTILRAFVVAGAPQREASYFRFPQWSRLIRQAIMWLGMPDPVGAKIVDASADARREAVRSLWQVFGSRAFNASDVDTAFRQNREEDDGAFRLRRRVVDNLRAVHSGPVEGPAIVGRALHKLCDLTFPVPASGEFPNGGTIKFTVRLAGAKNFYQLVFTSAEPTQLALSTG